MPKKLSNPPPELESPAAQPETRPDALALDTQVSPPAPDVAEASESIVAVVARLHARIFSLEARVDALATHHLQTYGKAI